MGLAFFRNQLGARAENKKYMNGEKCGLGSLELLGSSNELLITRPIVRRQ